jgi:hypothetical protein
MEDGSCHMSNLLADLFNEKPTAGRLLLKKNSIPPAHFAYLSRCKVGILEEFHVSPRK